MTFSQENTAANALRNVKGFKWNNLKRDKDDFFETIAFDLKVQL